MSKYSIPADICQPPAQNVSTFTYIYDKRIFDDRREVISLKEMSLGKITHYYSKIGVAIVELNNTLKAGEKVKIKGHSTEFEQTVDSMQVDHAEVEEAGKGEIIGMKVNDKVREGDELFKVE